MDVFQEEILNQIVCPICLQYMTPPIKQCLNGHNICKDCRHNIENCPVFRGNLADIRNLTAVSMSRLITHPCVNKKFGCTGHFCWISRSNTKQDVCSDLFVTRIVKRKAFGDTGTFQK
ncbi:hypothetical protein C0J52_22181 [Blattella germanica]|nr:hypothetical protein C0J52_22181 [Blattella germanica]